MSINFDEEISEKDAAKVREMFTDSVADDRKTFLLDNVGELNRRAMGEFARETGQPVSVELNDKGTTKTVGGFDFELLEEGWKRKPTMMDPKRIVFMNVPILTGEGAFFYRTCDAEHASSYLSAFPAVERISAVGHKSTAEAMTELLDEEVELNRIEYAALGGDVAIVLKLKGRVPEGQALGRKELDEIGFGFGIMTFAQPIAFDPSQAEEKAEGLARRLIVEYSRNYLGGLGDPEGHLQAAENHILGVGPIRRVLDDLGRMPTGSVVEKYEAEIYRLLRLKGL